MNNPFWHTEILFPVVFCILFSQFSCRLKFKQMTSKSVQPF